MESHNCKETLSFPVVDVFIVLRFPVLVKLPEESHKYF